MTTLLEDMPSVEVGERLRLARESARLKQAEAAAALNIARTTLIAIEKGQRRVRLGELQQLAKLYRTSVNALLRKEAIQVDLAPQFRKLGIQLDEAVADAAQLLSDLAKAEVELENLLGVKRVRNYPPERTILHGDVRAQAEQDALELRQWLGLGPSPILDIVTLLEMELGVRVYVRRMHGRISGLFAYDDSLGACILLNANHPRERRAQTAAHELAHLVSTRRHAEILDGGSTNSREERYAIAFARAFLTPARSVMQKFREVTAGSSKLTRRHVIVLGHTFGVSREAMVRRLEELGLTKDGTWDWFEQYGGITDEQAHQVLGDLPGPDIHKADADQPTTLRLGLLAGEAWRRGLLTEGQLSRMLHVDRIELRRMFDGLEIEGSEADGALLPD
ncbi:ImmA/IrrE family metallo-endopeptidase [Methylocystis sp. L43]|uniref:ImmA/IrrE family metallo-endopeptidase n=1 Tax=Methylocystis rosea TaxID=173366 RepID=A0ABX6EM10_9HYPH|nr:MULTISPECIES: XRE family transcriptional regulator [Methylocystis]MBG0797021.1 ImmA/IrrE family metallo-endopeptidase [Methylocystis sp. L43]MBG0804867.1 ImmA/IrrE family metallo-endopeptidase [Methylocystis sp. H15]QGM95764.1 ImmA/IrrE family metallo-endopeptidase [Methylocystis rosea]